MENNKLDNLFDAARRQEPSVSFDDAMDMLNKKADEPKYIGGLGISRFRNLFLGAITGLVIVGGLYVTYNNSKQKQVPSVSQVIDNSTVANNSSLQAPATGIEGADINGNTEQAIGEEPGINEAKPATSVEPVNSKPAVKKKDEHFGSIVKNAYLLENQTVNISNDKGKFRIHFTGNDVTRIEMNDVQVEQEQWTDYEDIVTEARSVKSSMGISPANSGNKKFVDYLFSTLKQKGLIENNLSTIRFSKDDLLIDGAEADSATHQLLIERYKSMVGEDIGSRTLYFN